MAYLPMAVYGLEVPPGDLAVSARPDIPAAFRITMAAIDPSAEAVGDASQAKRATLKIIRMPITSDDYDLDDSDDSDDESFDAEAMEAMLAGAEEDDSEDDDEDEDEDDEETNGGPSDPAKTKKARKAAAEAQIRKLLEAEGMDMDEDGNINGINGVKSAKGKGKMPVTDEDEDDEDDLEDDLDDDLEDDSEDEDEAEIEEFVICTLDTEKQYQQTLDIAIGEDERVWFKVTGTHAVYLTGNYIEPAGAEFDDEDSDESDDEDLADYDYDLSPDEDELEIDDLDDLADPRITEVDEEDDAPALVETTKSKKGKKRAADETDGLDAMIAEDAEPQLSKKQQKKQKKNDGTAAAVNGEAKTDKKVAFAKDIEQGPTPSKSATATSNPKSLSYKVVQGVECDDRKLGTGPAAKKGDRVGLRYIGKLQSGKVFDANKKGKPFTFKLGAGEVVKGMDVGVMGMSVGQERRITIPPSLGYGNKGMPDIPANSTLIFDIKILEINKGK